MNKLLEYLRNNSKLVKILHLFEYLFLSCYTFSLPAFSARNPYNIISYILMVLLIANTILITVIKKNYKFKLHFVIIPIFVVLLFIGTIIFSHNYRGILTLFLLSVTMFTFYFSFKIGRAHV